MRDLLLVPAFLLTFAGTSTAALQSRAQWPYNLPPTVKYFPEHEEQIRRHLAAQERLAWQTPVALRKMSGDEGEKFWLHDWDFAAQLAEEYATGNRTSPLNAPLAPLAYKEATRFGRLLGRALSGRAFQCPANTFSCGDGTDSCCPTGDTCATVSGGGIGCCAAGDNCDNAVVSDCNESAGFTPCQEAGGGCCIPGSQCVTGGCLISGTQTVFYTAPVTVTTGLQSSTSTASGTTIVGASLGTTTTTIVATSSTCSPGFNSCPASLGGGCCTQGYACGSTGCSCTSGCTTSRATAGAPIPPISVSSDTTTVSAAVSTVTSTNVGGCPTGYYMCSAYYLGGCCQVNRNCDTTSCPSTASTEVITSGPTVIVPYTSTSFVTGSDAVTVTSGTAAAAGVCASGWYLCPASVNGGCCLSGYVCGTASCSATVSGQHGIQKIAPSQASITGVAWVLTSFAIFAAIGMVML